MMWLMYNLELHARNDDDELYWFFTKIACYIHLVTNYTSLATAICSIVHQCNSGIYHGSNWNYSIV